MQYNGWEVQGEYGVLDVTHVALSRSSPDRDRSAESRSAGHRTLNDSI